MKHWLLTFSLLFVSAFALATPQHAILCEKQLDDAETARDEFIDLEEINIATTANLSPVVLKMVNTHLQWLSYAKTDLALPEIQKLFSEDGAFHSDELYVISYQSRSTGVIYFEVLSYPGDTYYSLIFDAQGNYLADNQDADITLHEGDQKFSCQVLNTPPTPAPAP